jgi:hypothetical protein
MAALAVLLLAPDRAGSVPGPTSTTSVFGLPASTPPNPLTLYPRRPGARYEDAEARPNQPVQLALAHLRLLRWRIEPHDALPGVARPAARTHYRSLGLADGYTPSETSTAGDVLRVVIRVKPEPLPAAPACVATTASDGTVLMPYDQPPPRPPRTTTTTDPSAPFELDLFFPIGARRGRVYLTCVTSFFSVLIGDDTRAVWGIDV